MIILGIDLAWGERNADGACVLDVRDPDQPQFAASFCVRGDAALLQAVDSAVGRRRAFACFDAPIVCPNPTGARPVDRLTHKLFHRMHAGCYPANLSKCPRPARLAQRLVQSGWTIGVAPWRGGCWLAEVYPHPAIVRWLGLDRIVKYKKGPSAMRKTEFARLQSGLLAWVRLNAPSLAKHPRVVSLLSEPLSKDAEDRTDAFVCALIGWRHWAVRGRQSEILGDLATGFILVPTPGPQRAAPRARPRQ